EDPLSKYLSYRCIGHWCDRQSQIRLNYTAGPTAEQRKKRAMQALVSSCGRRCAMCACAPVVLRTSAVHEFARSYTAQFAQPAAGLHHRQIRRHIQVEAAANPP